MRDYQRQKNNKFILPHTVWMQTLWLIRDYYRLKEKADNTIRTAVEQDGMPHGSVISDPTFAAVVRREMDMIVVDIIDTALSHVPREYRKGVWDSVMYRSPYPIDAGRATYARWKSRFVYEVARAMHLY